MGKPGKHESFDFIEEARYQAEHNANPYWWLGRIPRGGPPRGQFTRGPAILTVLICSPILGFLLWNLPGIFRVVPSALIVPWLLFIAGVAAIEIVAIVGLWQSFTQKEPEASRPAKGKKRQPKRRKDWHK